MNENPQTVEQFLKDIKNVLVRSNDDFITYPKSINSILDEKSSNWVFQIEMKNTCTVAKNIAIFGAGAGASRFKVIDAARKYPALGGGLVTTPYANGTIIKINDDPRLLNKISGFPVDCIATQEHANTLVEPQQITQTLYKDLTGELTLTSKDFYIDYLQNFISKNSARVWEMQFSSDNPSEAFSSKVYFKDLNPLRKDELNFINLEDYFLPESGIDTKIIVPVSMYLGSETFLAMTVPAATRLTATFKFSAYHSDLKAIRTKLATESIFASIQEKRKERPQMVQKRNENLSA